MFERYTEAARRVIFFARAEANHRDEAAIGPEDILLGLIRETKSGPLTAFHLEDRALDLRARMGIQHYPITQHPFLRQRDIPLNEEAKRVLAGAAREADRDRHYGIGCDHLMRGLLRLSNPASDALRECGIDLASARVTSRKYQRRRPKAAPRWYWFGRRMAKYRYLLVLFVAIFVLSLARC